MATLDDLVPSPDQVHSLIPTRPTFDDASTPTGDEVVGLARLAATDVAVDLPTGTDEGPLLALARWAVTLETASLVEASYYPEQNGGEGSTADTLHARYLAILAKLRATVGAVDPGSGGGSGSGGGTRGATARVTHPLLDALPVRADLLLP